MYMALFEFLSKEVDRVKPSFQDTIYSMEWFHADWESDWESVLDHREELV